MLEPGSWATGSKADAETLKKRKIVRARRGGEAMVAQAAAVPATAGPATGSGSAAGPPAANPFAGLSLVAPKVCAVPIAGPDRPHAEVEWH